MVDSINQETPTPNKQRRIAFRLIDLFVVTTIIAVFLAVANWNIGLAILVGLFLIFVTLLFRRKKETKNSVTALQFSIASIAMLGILCSLAEKSMSLFVIQDVYYYYYRDYTSLELDGMSITTMIEGKRSFFCIPPLVSGRFEGPPYKAGLSVIDVGNKNKPEKVQVTSLVLTCAGKSYVLVHKEIPTESTFDTYFDEIPRVQSECWTDVGEWLTKDNQSPIRIEMTFVIHKNDGVVESQIDETMLPADSSGWGLYRSP